MHKLTWKTFLTGSFALIITLGTLAGFVWKAVDVVKTQEVMAGDIRQLDHRLELKILHDQAKYLRSRLWALEDRYGTEQALRLMEYRQVQGELKDTEIKIQALVALEEGGD